MAPIDLSQAGDTCVDMMHGFKRGINGMITMHAQWVLCCEIISIAMDFMQHINQCMPDTTLLQSGIEGLDGDDEHDIGGVDGVEDVHGVAGHPVSSSEDGDYPEEGHIDLGGA